MQYDCSPGRSLKLNIREPASGMTLSADPAFILVIATVVLATAAVLGPEEVRTRAKTGDKNLKQQSVSLVAITKATSLQLQT